MRIALLETNIVWENKNENLERLKSDLSEIERCDIDVVLLPEMSFTGFSMNTEQTKDVSEETVKNMIKLAKANSIFIGAGWTGQDKTGYKNHYTIVNGKGIILDYEKVHPFSYGGEAEVFVGGTVLNHCNLNEFSAGIQICYDLRFPDLFQILSKSVSLIIIPANWPQKRIEHWDVLLRARAIENQVYIAGINCNGSIGGIEYNGHSTIISPDGKSCDASCAILNTGNKALIYEIDNDVNEYRATFPVKMDRREDLYQKLRIESR